MTLPTIPATPAPTSAATPSPKVIAAAVASFIIPAALLVLNYLTTSEGQALFLGLPIVAQIFIGGLITSAVTFLSGYVKRDPLRDLGAKTALLD